MATEKITMPQLGESVTEGTISQWLVREGEEVTKYDPLAEVMTDKVNAEVPSSFTGKIKELVVEEGETVAVGDLICYIEVEENSTDSVVEELEVEESKAEDTQTNNDKSMKTRYSPAVLKLAQENNINLEEVEGSGKSGRITRKDLERLIKEGVPSDVGKKDSVSEKENFHDEKDDKHEAIEKPLLSSAEDEEIPVTGIRKAIANNMVRSVNEIPHAWMMVEVDVTNMVAHRNNIKDEFFQKEGINLTFFSFFIKAVAKALKEFPELNSSWSGDKIIRRGAVNISIAVAKENELFVPVIKNADEKSMKGIAKDIHQLAKKTKEGKLTSEDMTGGTFTINNTGTFGSVQSMGIINHPQSAILQVESIVKKPVIIDGMFAARDMVNLCLSIDHRVLDGLIAGRFLSRVKETLETITEENTPVY